MLSIATTASAAAPQNAGSAAAQRITSNVDGRWVNANAVVEIFVAAPLPDASGRLAVVIGDVDWTGLCGATVRGLTCGPAGVPLPAGEHAMVVYLVSATNSWMEVARFQLRVLGRSGFEKADATPTIDFANKGQIATNHVPPVDPTSRDRYQDFTSTLGLTTSLVRGGWTTTTETTVIAVSHRPEALRFGELQDLAPYVDLSSYVVTAKNRVASFSLGHVRFGAHRHVLNDYSSRGATATLKLGSRADVSVNAANATAIVGWSNIVGLQETEHRVIAATVGIEMLARAGGLRLETSLLNATALPRSNFNQGSVTDAETNRGFGFRVLAADPRQRLRIDGGLAGSRFENPEDPLLAQGATLVPVRLESRLARYLDVSYAVLQDAPVGKTGRATLIAAYRHEMVEPLYGSLMSFVRSDVLQHVIELTGNIGPVALQASGTWAHDNLDAIPSILKTFTRVAQINLAVPLASVSHADTGAWLPVVTYTLDQTHQFGAELPVNSDFQDSHVPDQMSTNQLIGVEWQLERWHAGYRFNHSFQDNRQVGRALSDLANLTNNISLGFAPDLRVDVSVDLAFEGAENREFARTDLTRRVGFNGNWRPMPRTTITGSMAIMFLRNDYSPVESRTTDFNFQFAQGFPLSKRSSGKPQGQVFVRYARQSAWANPLTTLVQSHFWTVNTGVTFSLF